MRARSILMPLGAATLLSVACASALPASFFHDLEDQWVAALQAHDTAVVTGLNVLQGASSDDVVRVRFTDVFVKRHGRWRAVSAQETLETTAAPQR